MSEFGKIFIGIGIVFVVVGLILVFRVNIPWLGKLPGDISARRGNFYFYFHFPLGTSILISILLTLIFYLFRK
jgi:Protein of unknown function (DUF2905)